MARDLREARLPITQVDIDWLAGLLDLERQALVRTATEEERAEWDFYRVSARHPVEVWRRASRYWTDHLPLSSVSDLVGHSRREISSIVSGRTHWPVLTYSPAVRLSAVLQLETGPNAFLIGLPAHPR